MTKESGNITQTVRFVAMNRGVVIPKRSLQAIGPNAVELAEPFTDMSIERRIRPFLRTTLDNHVDQFNLLTLLKLNLQQFVNSFFVYQGIHNRQIYRPTKIHQICFSAIFNALLGFSNFLVV